MNLSLKTLGSYGRLGNQMFQYAALRGIATLSNRKWKIPMRGTGTDDYGLFEVFKMNSVTEENLITNENYANFVIKNYECVLDTYLDVLKFKYPNNNIDLSGNYFQSWIYFEHIKEEIRKDFTIKEKYTEQIDDDYIFLHIRRGDYTKLQQFHPLCPMEYYEKALSFYPDDITVKIFSDDLEWCKNTFKNNRFIIKNHNVYFENQIKLPTGIEKSSNPYYDLYSMSMAKGAIIANSSLSWWGAWLIKNNTYPIIAPDPWFGANLNHNTKDLIPPTWKIISY